MATNSDQDDVLSTESSPLERESSSGKANPALQLRLHELIERQAAATPDAHAIAHHDRKVSYRTLEEQSRRVAVHLKARGVLTGSLVGVQMRRSPEFIIALLGVLRSGAAYVPLDPEYPRDRLAFMLRDCQAAAYITESELADALLPQPSTRVLIEDIPSALPPPLIAANVAPDHLAYVIYTSGSTGTPKGVAVSHANAVYSTLARSTYYIDRVTSFLLLSSFAFDSSIAGLFWTLSQGGTLVLPPAGTEGDPSALARAVSQNNVSHLLGLPSLYALMLNAEEQDHLKSLQCAIVAGETCPVELVKEHHRRLKNTALFNEYGPTECTVWSTVYRCLPEGRRTTVPIGQTIPGTSALLLDDNLEQALAGEVGEICIAGPGVTQGYLYRPELTAERFIVHPLSPSPDQRLYRTGDHGRLLPDGNLDFCGRFDQQVKIRGYRIELGDIESALALHASLEEAVVSAPQDAQGNRRLVAYLVVRRGCETTVNELRAFLEQQLPSFMVPSSFVWMKDLPRMPNGKVDRKALPAPSRQRPPLDVPYVEPQSPVEQWLTRLWCRTLGLDEIGCDDRFFELGGDSLQAAMVVREIQKELGEYIYIVTLFEHPTVADYAAFLEKHYAVSVAKRLELKSPNRTMPSPLPAEKVRAVDEAAVQELGKHIPRRSTDPCPETVGPKNGPALFILAPPRSGTTLLRVMLAGHPGLFSASELQLLNFQSLGERRTALTGRFSAWLEGTLRAVMELQQCDADEAKRIMAVHEDRDLSTCEFYGVLQDWIGARMLVDKSPSYAFDPDTLRQAEVEFSEPLYIHLHRHPFAMTTSFQEMHMDQVLYLHDHGCTPRELGELLWVISHRNILTFLEGVPASRQHHLSFEDLTAAPRDAMENLCRGLGLAFHPALLTPYEQREEKMTDGLYVESEPMGDIRFQQHGRIDPNVADRWQGVAEDDFLGDITWALAERLGYRRLTAGEASRVTGSPDVNERRERQRQRRQRRHHLRDDIR